ncbi:NEP1-INTERACTING PROTEIN-LIKE 2 [Salix purpurea]|uniref:NEP1-INTERACTING PROTEIN-LIKE 2 n=1 Tax=Salix purpurea TaxID=77065 RepID=A0A9Q1A0D1_SALPP|nr:NEP1-INTERACTING PROTEIN-LIKE 2 [Salix purpurea]
MMKRWFSGITKTSLRFKEAASFRVFAARLEGFGTGLFIRVLKNSVFAASTCVFALGGALVGSIIGAMKGQTTETGFLRGSGVGAVAGAITAVQLLESITNGEPLSKVALLHSLLNGKVFIEWVGPALLKAYQWQITALETTYREISDIYDTSEVRGMSEDCIKKLPECTFKSDNNIVEQCCPEFSCAICLQDFRDGDSMRKLPYCGHCFHMSCLDKWLTRNGSCPNCRNYVCNDNAV